jgi:rifampicin phosphotransferase
MTTVADATGFPGPDQIEGFWAFDKMHAPRPITPLASDLIVMTLATGFTNAHTELDAPTAVTNKMVNYYYYASFHPLVDLDELAARKEKYEASLATKVPPIGRKWTEEWQPAIEAAHRYERSLDYTTFTDAQLLAKLDELEQRMIDQWTVHGRINFVLVSSAKYCDYYDALMEPADPTESYQSIQGWETQSLAAARGLWSLSRLVRASKELTALFDAYPPDDLAARLPDSEIGREFLGRLDDYLEDFGWRSDAVYDIADVTWRENPAIPLGALNSYRTLDDNADPDVLHERSVATRQALLAKARAKLAADPGKLAEFEELYEIARYSNPVTENHAFWIDQMGIAVIRRFALEIGRRRAERGQIDAAADVFMLYRNEIAPTVSDGTDRREITRIRRTELDAWSKVSPPPVLGTPPPPEYDPFMDAVTVRLLGITPPSDAPQDPDVLKGVAGAPGVVRGRVRVVKSLGEASVLDDGDIMVCEMTLPPWVPLFSIVGGVVADTGGVLSHCAIVAREFELPAVVGTMFGTSFLQDGMLVEVDGSSGTVTILERP